ncbi:MAG: hypothetical protein M3Q98_08740 [Actinomycetota bacterium]|nr:hypothetical protein [Actinomycetota bacterium]
MSTSDKALSKKRRRPLRKLIFLAVIAGIGVAIKNALEDKGGSYEPPAAEQPSTASVPTPPVPSAKVVTAEDIVEQRPVENLDEFADPVEPGLDVVPEPEPVAEEPAAAEEEPTREDPAIAEAVAEAEDPDELRETPGKIDPFGIR